MMSDSEKIECCIKPFLCSSLVGPKKKCKLLENFVIRNEFNHKVNSCCLQDSYLLLAWKAYTGSAVPLVLAEIVKAFAAVLPSLPSGRAVSTLPERILGFLDLKDLLQLSSTSKWLQQLVCEYDPELWKMISESALTRSCGK